MNPEKKTERPVFELKGSVLTVMVLQINETDPDLLYPGLVKKIEQGRAFFANAPVLVDFSSIEVEEQLGFNFTLLAQTLRDLGVVPVAVRGAAPELIKSITDAGMGVLPAIRGEKSKEVSGDIRQGADEPAESGTEQQSADENTAAQPVESTGAGAPTKVISLPVRSGQQVLAPEGDLIILSTVNAGAEVLAAGNIHVYGALRGRAMAGINGDRSARVFSLQCNPELVAVAGEYVVNEELDESIINHSVVISFADDQLQFTPIGMLSPAKH